MKKDQRRPAASKGPKQTIDISAERSMRGERERLETYYQAFLDHTPAAIYVKDDQGRHVFANQTLLAMFGLSLERFIGTTSDDIFPVWKPSKW